jgi:hypothetical protein
MPSRTVLALAGAYVRIDGLQKNEQAFESEVSLAAQCSRFVTPLLSRSNGTEGRTAGQTDLTLLVPLATLAGNGSPDRLDADRRRP